VLSPNPARAPVSLLLALRFSEYRRLQSFNNSNMAMHNLLERLQACRFPICCRQNRTQRHTAKLTISQPSGLELRRLEDKYVRRKTRTCYISNATYVDGEYVYPSSTSLSSKQPTSMTTTRDSKQSTSTSTTTTTRDSKYGYTVTVTSGAQSSKKQQDKRWSRSWGYRGPIPSAGNRRR
jgi:hypothetical protein